jgi:hypothetical protein
MVNGTVKISGKSLACAGRVLKGHHFSLLTYVGKTGSIPGAYFLGAIQEAGSIP